MIFVNQKVDLSTTLLESVNRHVPTDYSVNSFMEDYVWRLVDNSCIYLKVWISVSGVVVRMRISHQHPILFLEIHSQKHVYRKMNVLSIHMIRYKVTRTLLLIYVSMYVRIICMPILRLKNVRGNASVNIHTEIHYWKCALSLLTKQ